MYLRFVGDANGEGPDVIEAFGYEFAKHGGAVLVEGAALEKLSRNSHFERVGPPTLDDDKPASKAELLKAAKQAGADVSPAMRKADIAAALAETQTNGVSDGDES